MGDLCITGISCWYQGAPDLSSLWQSICQNKDLYKDPPGSLPQCMSDSQLAANIQRTMDGSVRSTAALANMTKGFYLLLSSQDAVESQIVQETISSLYAKPLIKEFDSLSALIEELNHDLESGLCDLALVLGADCRKGDIERLSILCLETESKARQTAPFIFATISLDRNSQKHGLLGLYLLEASSPSPRQHNSEEPVPLIGCSSEAERIHASAKMLPIICAALALSEATLPPTRVSFEQESPALVKKKLYLNSQTRPWICPRSPQEPNSKPRLAIIDSESHFLLLREELSKPPQKLTKLWKQSLLLLGADSEESLREKIIETIELCELDEERLVDLAHRLNQNLKKEDCFRLGLLTQDSGDLAFKLMRALELLACQESWDGELCLIEENGLFLSHIENPGKSADSLCFVYPGLGASYPNMLMDLCLQFDVVKKAFDFGDFLAAQAGDKQRPSQEIFPPDRQFSPWPAPNQASLARMDSAVVVLLLAEWALYELLEEFGVKAKTLVGCSTGEFAALTMNGCFDLMEAAKTFYALSTTMARSVSIEDLEDLRSIKVSASYGRIRQVLQELDEPIYLSAELSPTWSLLSGSKSAIEKARSLLRAVPLEVYPLPIAIPYHTPLVKDVLQADNSALSSLAIYPPKIQSWSCSLAAPYPAGKNELIDLSTHLFEKPILLADTILGAYHQGARIFVEVGPKGTLAPLIRESLEGLEQNHAVHAANLAGRSGIEVFQRLLAFLHCSGIAINRNRLAELDKGRLSQPSLQQSPPIFSKELSKELSSEPELDLIMTNYLHSMGDFHTNLMQTQQEVFLAYLQSLQEDSPDLPSLDNLGPLLRDAKVEVIADGIKVDLVLDLEKHHYLLDHAIGGAVETEFNSRVYLMPLMVALELMAECAACLFGGQQVVKLTDIRAYRRIRVSHSSTAVSIIAKYLDGEPEQVAATIYSIDPGSEMLDVDDANILMASTIHFAQSYPPPPALSPTQEEVSLLGKQGKELYGESSMFHGPRMQGLSRLNSLGRRYIDGQIGQHRELNWLEPDRADFLLNPLLLDSASQLVLYYLFETDCPVSALLPFHIESIEFFQSSYDCPSNSLSCSAQLSQAGATGTTATLNVWQEPEKPILRVKNINSRKIELDAAWRSFIGNPCRELFRQALAPGLQLEKIEERSCLIVLSGKVLPSDDTVLDWLTDYWLAEDEASVWQELKSKKPRGRQWLLGRLAAKLALSSLDNGTTKLKAADICILNDTDGKPFFSPKKNTRMSSFMLSLSHKGDSAAAFISRSGLPGIDLEDGSSQTILDSLELAFCPEELKLIRQDQSEDGRSLLAARLFSAKEACLKALGKGLSLSAKALRCLPETSPTGKQICLNLDPAQKEKLPGFEGAQANSVLLENLVLSYLILENPLENG